MSVISVYCLFLVCSLLPAGLLPVSVGANSQDTCHRDPPDTEASKTPGDNGFRIKIAGRPQPDRYVPEHVYTISINGTYPNQRLLGFMLVAVPLNALDESTAMGTFQHMNSGVTKFADACYWVVQHTYKHPKAGVEILWTAPPQGTGCIEFRATVIEYKDIWYKDDGALTRVFCEETHARASEVPASLMPECCACGAGKYEVTFHGLWSRHTHPKDYPEHRALLHWSNIVGASHNTKYVPWQYGAYASAGVKEVCEFGYPRKMEEEMRQHSQDVRTVIKTPGIWWKDPVGLLQTRWARFSVDRRHHLLSLLTMIGPSPDWCVGVSSLNLCLPNCTWSGDQFIDLYPWDAGTDDGINYMSANQKSSPPQKIHRITNTFPNNPASPFFSREPIRPLARLEIKRLNQKPAGSSMSCSDSDAAAAEDDDEAGGGGFPPGTVETSEDVEWEGLSDMEKKKLMMMQSGKCGLSDWTDWTECSVTCGVGQKVRKRMYHNPMVDEDMCGQPTMEQENCIGVENECGDIAPGCEATQWTEWSPCSVTCGQGIQDRRRYYLDKTVAMGVGCDRVMAEQQMCIAEIEDCRKAIMMKNFTAICSQPLSTGNCRGNFQRWHFDPVMQKCLPFDYSGCRGNENRFRSQEECIEMCVQRLFDEGPRVGSVIGGEDDEELKKQMMLKQQMMEKQIIMERQRMEEEEAAARKKAQMMAALAAAGQQQPNIGQSRQDVLFPPVLTPAPSVPSSTSSSSTQDCMVSVWTAWSTCSATCGKSFKYKRRMIKQEAGPGGHACPKKLERRKRCDVPKCPTDCELGSWSEWTPCLHTCLQERTRQVVSKPRHGGAECGARLSRRDCSDPPCVKALNPAAAASKDNSRRVRRRRRH